MAKKKPRSLDSRPGEMMDIDNPKANRSMTPKKNVEEDSTLSARHEAGVLKKQKKAKPLSRQRRLRREKGIDRADDVFCQLKQKVAQSHKRGHALKERRTAWEDLNGTIKELSKNVPKQKRKKAAANRHKEGNMGFDETNMADSSFDVNMTTD